MYLGRLRSQTCLNCGSISIHKNDSTSLTFVWPIDNQHLLIQKLVSLNSIHVHRCKSMSSRLLLEELRALNRHILWLFDINAKRTLQEALFPQEKAILANVFDYTCFTIELTLFVCNLDYIINLKSVSLRISASVSSVEWDLLVYLVYSHGSYFSVVADNSHNVGFSLDNISMISRTFVGYQVSDLVENL